jgi:hypothetical protein
VFQNGDDNNLSHPFNQSSRESSPPYCRPIQPNTDPTSCNCTDKQIWDTGTCATNAFTDKGVFSQTESSLYPPRGDLMRTPSTDSASVDMYAAVNPFDTISQATPAGGSPTSISWAAPPGLTPGNYVLFVELSKEFDFNATYNSTNYPPPCGTCIPWSSYGLPYRGQPSVVYSATFTVGASESIVTSMDYIGYGDPDGNDGAIRPPDDTITTDTPGSGASRLELVSDSGTMYRLRVDAKPELDFAPPDAPAELASTNVTSTSAALRFIAPGDDGQIGNVSGYEVRIRADSEITEDNFADSMPTGVTITPGPPGSIQTFVLDALLPETDYWVGVRALDDCHNQSTLSVVKVTTSDRESGTVDACFVATAAYGSVMANDVTMLRHLRDSLLRSNVLGELAVETYYTFGPPVAGTVGESDLLRATARDVLAPIVARVRSLSF